MEYYKVIRDAQTYDPKKGRYYGLVKDELLTLKELTRYKVPLSLIRAVQVKRNRTFWAFGARFELKCINIEKEFTSLKQAESYQNKLYKEFNNVECLTWPQHGEAGKYAWRCY